MQTLSHDRLAAALRRPDKPQFGDRPREIKPIEKVSRTVISHETRERREILVSVARVPGYFEAFSERQR
jgi:hypothetical protein